MRKKHLLSLGMISTLAFTPLAAIACGSSSSVKQADVDAEQTVVNGLSGTKAMTKEADVTAITNQTFTAAIATGFGLTGFTPKSGYTYTYSHGAITTDGSVAVTITVKNGSLTGASPTAISIAVTGIDMGKTETALKALKTTTKTDSVFTGATVAADTALATAATTLGFTAPTIGTGVTVTVAKAASSKTVTYTLKKTGQTDRTVAVDWTGATFPAA